MNLKYLLAGILTTTTIAFASQNMEPDAATKPATHETIPQDQHGKKHHGEQHHGKQHHGKKHHGKKHHGKKHHGKKHHGKKHDEQNHETAPVVQ